MSEEMILTQKKKDLKHTTKELVKKYFLVTLGSVLYSVAIGLFLEPNFLAPGVVTGISIILGKVFNVKTGTLIFLINVPLLLLGFYKFGSRFFCSTLYSILVTSVVTNGISGAVPVTEDLFLTAVFGSMLVGLGIGIVFKAGATTGGADIIVRLLRAKIPHLKTGILYLIMDTVIVTIYAICFGKIDKAMYSALCVMGTSYVLDFVLYGRDSERAYLIISKKGGEIADKLMKELSVGVTFLDGQGAFLQKDKKIILCVVKRPMAPKVWEMVRQEDYNAFMIISNVCEVYGEGHKSYFGIRY